MAATMRQADDWPLPPKQERFAQNIAEGLALNTAYVEAGYKSDKSAGNAMRLLDQDRVSRRVAGLLAARETAQREAANQAIAAAAVTKEWIMNMLRRNAEICLSTVPFYDSTGAQIGIRPVNAQAGNTALHLLGKAKGMFIDRTVHSIAAIDADLEAMSPEERRAEADRLVREMGLVIEHQPSVAPGLGGNGRGNGDDA